MAIHYPMDTYYYYPHPTNQEELVLGVPIGKERLFEVDVRTLRVRYVTSLVTTTDL